jgi:hypothetical protein
MATLAEIRQQYPQYESVSDDELADKLYNKFYAGKVERSEFDAKLGIGKSVGGFLGNVVENTGKVFSGLATAASDPVKMGKDLVKTTIGMGQQFVPGQQEYEAQYADPLYKSVGRDLGFSRGQEGIEWSPSQLGENLYERPVDVTLSAGLVAAPTQGLPGRVGRMAQTAQRVTNPISAAGRGVTSVAKRAITPFPGRGASVDAANVLHNEGVRVTAGQRTGSRGLKYAESELGGGATARIVDQQGEQFTRAASRRIGEDTPHLDGPTMAAAYDRIGNEIGDVARRNVLAVTPNLERAAYNAEGLYNRRVPATQRAPVVAEFGQEIRNLQGRVPGDIYQDLRSRIGAEARAATDPHVQHALYGLQRALDDAFQRSVSSLDGAALRQARAQYRNYLVLEDAMATGGQQTAAGILTPARLEQAAGSRLGRRAYLHGTNNDFAPLAKAGKVAMSAMPESGTSARLAINAVPAAVGGVVGGAGMGGVGAVAGAIAGRLASGRALMSRPVQAYLGNQLAPREMTRAGRVAGAVGRPLATVASRQEDLKHAENVVSPKVMEHIKKSPNTRGLLNEWLKARASGEGAEEATTALAQAIAAEVQKPELAGRIADELNRAKGP